jgi:hypothetical protein
MGSAEHDTGWAFNNQRFSDMTLILTTPGAYSDDWRGTSSTGSNSPKRSVVCVLISCMRTSWRLNCLTELAPFQLHII